MHISAENRGVFTARNAYCGDKRLPFLEGLFRVSLESVYMSTLITVNYGRQIYQVMPDGCGTCDLICNPIFGTLI